MKKTVIISLFIIALTSCEDFFISDIDIDVPEHKSQLVPITFLGTNTLKNGSNNLQLSKSIATSNYKDTTYYISGAKISIATDSVVTKFQEIADNQGIYKADNLNFTDGETYRLTVEKEGYKNVSAEAVFPTSVPIIEAGIDNKLLKVKFQDDPNAENYYMVTLLSRYSEDSDYSSEWLEPYQNDYFNADYDLQGVMFTDETFNGKVREFRALLEYFHIEDYTDVYVILSHITKDYYLHQKSLYINYDAQENPFVEPVFIHSNTDSNYGILAFRNDAQKQLK